MNKKYKYKVLSKLLPIENSDDKWITEKMYEFDNKKIDWVITEQIEENGMRSILFDKEEKAIIMCDQKYLPDVEDLGECQEEVCIVFDTLENYERATKEVLNNKVFEDYIDVEYSRDDSTLIKNEKEF